MPTKPHEDNAMEAALAELADRDPAVIEYDDDGNLVRVEGFDPDTARRIRSESASNSK